MAGNFDFVKKYNNSLYGKLYNAESVLKTDYAEAGANLRSALERFVNGVIEKYRLNDAINSYCQYISDKEGKRVAPNSLFGRIRFLTDFNQIRRLNIKGIRCLECRYKPAKQPNFVNYRVSAKYRNSKGEEVYRKIEEGDDRDIDPFTFVRWVGNVFSHDSLEVDEPMVKATYENVLEAFRVMYYILSSYYRENANKGYDENRVPLKGYDIIASYVPSDSETTGCVVEHTAKILVSKMNNIWKWLVIREYNKSDVDEHFILRGYDAIATINDTLFHVPTATVETRKITDFDSDSPYYIIAYVFKREPQKLGNIISKISFENRYEMCLQIAKYFEQLYSLEEPIYHRMLSHNSIYGLDCNDVGIGWIPSVFKFNFSKMTMLKGNYTVYDRALQASKKIEAAKEQKYLAPEWSTANADTKWEKIDIFSLGVLFCDILCGEILPDFNAVKAAGKRLVMQGVNDEVITIIGKMMSSIIDDRPNITTIVETLETHKTVR